MAIDAHRGPHALRGAAALPKNSLQQLNGALA